MDNPVEEVKKRIDIVDFIGAFISLKKAGRNFKALCPFHQERTPSLIISLDRQIWHCFGACQTGGDVITFLMKWERLTFYEALKTLAEKAGVALSKIDFEDKAWQKKERLLRLNQASFEFYHYLLTKHSFGRKAQEYLEKRGLNQKLITTFGLGYSPSSWDSLLKFLKKRGFSPFEGFEAGLLVKSGKGRFYDRFRKRIIFPICNPVGQIIGFSGRVINGEQEAKYVNIAETAIYHKRESLFGINLAKEAIKKTGLAILVEGEFDMISCFREGVTNVVAVKGSAVTHEQLMLLKRFAKKVIFCLDADLSGQETTKKAITAAENLDFEIGVVSFGGFKDPDEAVRNDPVQFKQNLDHPVPLYDFVMQTAHQRFKGDDAFSKKNIGDEVVPFLAAIRNPIVQSHYMKKLAEMLDVERRAIELMMTKTRQMDRKRKTPLKRRSVPPVDRFELIQKYVLHLIFQDRDTAAFLARVNKVIAIDDFSILSYRKLLETLADVLAAGVSFEVNQFTQRLPKELLSVFDEVILFDVSIFDGTIQEKTLTRTLYELKQLSLKKRIKILMNTDEVAEADVRSLLMILSQVEKKLAVV